MGRLEQLREANPGLRIDSVYDKESFKTYGRIVEGYDFTELLQYMEERTEIPENGNVYVASVPEMERMPIMGQMQKGLYGDMPIQIGYCNGRNSTMNGFEYHKGSEINVAVCDFCICLGHSWDIEENRYDIEKVKVFFVPKGTAIEMYQTTLHLSPCRVMEEGFRGVVVLPKGTNTPLEKEKPVEAEGELLLQRNKWVIAHPEREPLMRQGAVGGVLGENKEIKY